MSASYTGNQGEPDCPVGTSQASVTEARAQASAAVALEEDLLGDGALSAETEK